MKYLLITCMFCFSTLFVIGQNLSGVWKGSFFPNGTTAERGTPTYLELSIDNAGSITGKSRSEVLNTPDYAVKNIKGQTQNNQLSFSEVVVAKKANGSKTKWCRMQCQVTYNAKTGYLEGTYSSNECKNFSGKIILYQDEIAFPQDNEIASSHIWFELLAKDLKKGLNAPVIRKQERHNFIFTPIYFDYDKAEIKGEFTDFLNRLIHVVEGHSDLRVKVTGHTDSDGSDAYNDDLSKRRAQAIIDYFVAKGLSADRLEFDFKGEKVPAASNSTSEGRQQNRRVDFEFI